MKANKCMPLWTEFATVENGCLCSRMEQQLRRFLWNPPVRRSTCSTNKHCTCISSGSLSISGDETQVIIRDKLTHFSPVSHFYTSWKLQKTFGFLTFSEGREMWYWTNMGQVKFYSINKRQNEVILLSLQGFPVTITHFMPMASFYSPWQQHNTSSFQEVWK